MLVPWLYRDISLEHRRVAEKFSLGSILWLQYEAATELLDDIIKTIKETIKDQDLSKLLYQLDFLANKVKEQGAIYQTKDRYISAHESQRTKKPEGGKKLCCYSFTTKFKNNTELDNVLFIVHSAATRPNGPSVVLSLLK